ncbi:MAG: response regulator [Bdellovibrionales bacterium]|nr:response regulator [Bdellovibrionales bacterium]
MFKEELHGQLSPNHEKRANRPTSVLIVDDDVDSALQMGSVFSHLGCDITCSLGWLEAKKKMCSLKTDIIILDWKLDRHIDASDIVDQCSRTFRKFGEGSRRQWPRPKIITYSGLHESEIRRLENPYFQHLAHWRKPIGQRELLARVLQLLKQIER